MSSFIQVSRLAVFCLCLWSGISFAQGPNDLTADERSTVVDSVNKLLMENYVFPDVAEEMAELLKSKLGEGAYDEITNPQEYASILTADLQSVSKDLHLRVGFNPEQAMRLRAMEDSPDDEEPSPEMLQQLSFNNFGFQEVKMLEGNIGYLDLRGFYDTRFAGETAVAAMNFLSNSSALIIDLRNNGGGSPSMIQLITSYLYDQEDPVHLNNFYWRPDDVTTQTWTLPYVPGKKIGDADVYVLTSGQTFSAAEEFTYNLKNLERATIVGETTGGGAHPGGTRPATDRFTVWVPSGRAINPVTNTNWEGTGVTPHVDVPSQDALAKAHLMALQTLAETEGPMQQRYEWYVPVLNAQVNPAEIDAELLKSYAGTFGPRTLMYKDGQLFYSREGREPRPLIPLANDLFFMEDVPYFRLKDHHQENGEVQGLRGLYDNGHQDYSPKDKA